MQIEKAMVGGLVSVAALAAGSQAASAQNWTGAYAGLSVNSNHGELPFNSDYKLDGVAVLGGFVGTRWSSGNYVIGAELALQGYSGGDADGEGSDPEDYRLGPMVDLKFSVGKPIGNTLVYGFVGASAANVDTAYNNYASFGANFGIGVDYRVSNSFSVGAELTHRVMNGYENDSDYVGISTVALRASFHF
jgi:opacity protein-like surface antigen